MDETSEIDGLPFRGVLEDLPIDLLIGWSVHYKGTYAAATRAQDLESLPQGVHVVVAAAHASDGGLHLDISACGRSDAITVPCARWQTTAHNGVLWYLEPGKAFGFADRSELRTDRRRGADTAEGRLRVSWHLDGHGGYRAGSLECLNHDSSWHKLVFRRDIRPSATWLLPSIPGEGADLFGTCTMLHASDGSSQAIHCCLLRCRCPALQRRLGAQKDVYLPGVSKRTLRNLNAYIYGGLLPWELEPQLEPKDLLPCVVELMNAAKFMELDPLQRICVAWLKVFAKDELSPEDKTCAAADHVEQSRIEELPRLSPGMVIGNGCPGAVLEEDMAKLLIELDDPSSYVEDKVTVGPSSDVGGLACARETR